MQTNATADYKFRCPVNTARGSIFRGLTKHSSEHGIFMLYVYLINFATQYAGLSGA